VPCRQFLRADAERLATEPPADAAVPLERSGCDVPKGSGMTPYVASLYQTRLLTRDEEQYYFRRMNWLKFRAATARGRLDRRRAGSRQIDQIEAWLAEAEAVRTVLVTANLRLVVSIAKALLRSVEKFNFALGNRFSTYATYAIQRHFFRLSHKGRQLRSRFISDDDSFKGRAAAERDSEACSSAQVDVLKELFGRFLADLEPRERQIVVARFGFDGRPPRTFRELGGSMGVCKERIRQIQTRAIDKLRDMADDGLAGNIAAGARGRRGGRHRSGSLPHDLCRRGPRVSGGPLARQPRASGQRTRHALSAARRHRSRGGRRLRGCRGGGARGTDWDRQLCRIAAAQARPPDEHGRLAGDDRREPHDRLRLRARSGPASQG
jgi:RNA polymerase sigma factor (sigma-70 family)